MSRSGTAATDAQSASRRLLVTRNKDENVVLELRPCHWQLMHVACLWSRWTKPGESDLLSFAAITDDLPPKIEAAGHDRWLRKNLPGMPGYSVYGLDFYRDWVPGVRLVDAEHAARAVEWESKAFGTPSRPSVR
ncbi:hypothetical protein WL37_03575 [Burkholderia ubonensis]|nr:hypothetical protein WL37_03575 [Burkholderia ubonensis]